MAEEMLPFTLVFQYQGCLTAVAACSAPTLQDAIVFTAQDIATRLKMPDFIAKDMKCVAAFSGHLKDILQRPKSMIEIVKDGRPVTAEKDIN